MPIPIEIDQQDFLFSFRTLLFICEFFSLCFFLLLFFKYFSNLYIFLFHIKSHEIELRTKKNRRS